MARVADPARRYRFVRRRLAYVVAIALGGASNAVEMPAIGPRGPFDWRGLPITFERNDGQHEPAVLFSSRGPHGILTLRSGEIAITPRRGSTDGPAAKLKLAGANPAPEVEPLRPLVARSHYYRGSASFTDVPHFAELRMKDVYPGIDVDVHGRTGTLEYDFVVAPGADPHDIRIDLHGASGASIDAEGNLRLEFEGQSLVQHAPVAYQEIAGNRRDVDARFELAGGEARIALGNYDRSAPLTVDPVIAYSTYVGSSGSDISATGMKVDADGRVYFVQRENAGVTAPIVVTKLDPFTNTLIYQTSFAGTSGYSLPADAALGASGSIYVVGRTTALDFPAVPSKVGTSLDAFVVKLGAGGSLEAGYLIGGSGDDVASAVALDPAGNVYVTGTTFSNDLPVTTGPSFNLGVLGSPAPDGFVAKLSPTLARQYVRYLGGSGSDYLYGIDVDSGGQVVVVGGTDSASLPPAPSFGTQIPPTGNLSRGFAAKLSADGAFLLYCQYVGGQSHFASAVAIDPYSSDALIAGVISSATLTPPSVRAFAGSFDAFVLRLRSDGMPTYATYVGGSGADTPLDIALDARGNVYVTGYTTSFDFPQVAPLAGMSAIHQPPPGESGTGGYGAFVARLRDGELDFSTTLGGSGADFGTAIATGSPGTAYVAGYTAALDFPTVTPYRGVRLGLDDGFVTKISGLDERRAEFAGDFNGDGKADMLWQNADGAVWIWIMDGGVQLGGEIIRPPYSGWTVALVADFNGDSRADLLWTRDDGSAEVWLMNGTAVLGQRAVRGAGTGWWPVHAADFGGDGKADILWQHRDGSTEITMMKGALVASHDALRGPGTGWAPKLVGDFNGDGKADILWRREDGSAKVWLMNGGTALTGGEVMPAGSWTPTHTGDFDGDGKADVLWRNANGSTMLTLMDGVSVAASTALTGPGSGIRVTHVGDLDADGRADIIVRGRGGSLAMWLMNGTSIVRTAQMTNTISRWVPRRVADFMGNHRAGIVLYDRGTTRLWFTNPDGSPNIVQLMSQGSPWLPFGFDE